MAPNHPIIKALLALGLCNGGICFGNVPSAIHYQGRLTDSSGVPTPGNHLMTLRIFDAPTTGNLLYTENLGNVPADANGVYAFSFGESGTSNASSTETLAMTNGTATTYQKTLNSTSVIPGSVHVSAGTFSWDESVGNPGSTATATATIMSGFVIGANLTVGGSGYTSPPTITISGDGTGASAIATLTNGSVSSITITSAGSGYTNGATITIAPPPAPFLVDYANGTITVNYQTAPEAGTPIIASYLQTTTGVLPALSSSPEQWLELNVDGNSQTPRQRVLSVPYATISNYAENATGSLQQQINDINNDLALMSAGMPSETIFTENFSVSKSSVISNETSLTDKGVEFAPIIEHFIQGQYAPLNQIISNKIVRGVYCKYEWGGNMPGTLIFTYADNTTTSINITMIGGYIYIPNPSPDKKVLNINLSPNQGMSWNTFMKTIEISSGALTIKINDRLKQRTKMGLFVNTKSFGNGDVMTAILIGTNGNQEISINNYTRIKESIGIPQKIRLDIASGASNLEAYPAITGYTIRYSD